MTQQMKQLKISIARRKGTKIDWMELYAYRQFLTHQQSGKTPEEEEG